MTERVPTRTRAGAIGAGPESRANRRGAWIGAAAVGLVAGGIAVTVLRASAQHGEAGQVGSTPSAASAAAAVKSASAPLPAVTASAAPIVSAAPAVSVAPRALKRSPSREDPYDAAPAPSPRASATPPAAPTVALPPELLN